MLILGSGFRWWLLLYCLQVLAVLLCVGCLLVLANSGFLPLLAGLFVTIFFPGNVFRLCWISAPDNATFVRFAHGTDLCHARTSNLSASTDGPNRVLGFLAMLAFCLCSAPRNSHTYNVGGFPLRPFVTQTQCGRLQAIGALSVQCFAVSCCSTCVHGMCLLGCLLLNLAVSSVTT